MLLDATVLIDALRRRPAVLTRLREHGGPFFTSALSVDEVLFGVLPVEEARTAALIHGLEVVTVGLAEARLASTWRRSFRSNGVTLDQVDCLIAASAVTRGMPFATANVKDFPMPELHVEHWPSA